MSCERPSSSFNCYFLVTETQTSVFSCKHDDLALLISWNGKWLVNFFFLSKMVKLVATFPSEDNNTQQRWKKPHSISANYSVTNSSIESLWKKDHLEKTDGYQWQEAILSWLKMVLWSKKEDLKPTSLISHKSLCNSSTKQLVKSPFKYLRIYLNHWIGP